MQGKLQRGTIILAKLNDHHGKISEHFGIITTSTADIQAGADLAVVGISTKYNLPLPPHWFALKTHPRGLCETKLRRPCVAKASWQDVVKQGDVIEIRGRAPAGIVRQILKYIESHP